MDTETPLTDPSARSLRAHCGTLAQPSADALTPRALTDARPGPRPRALGVRGSDADARRPIDPGQGARRAHGTAFGRLDATTAGAGHAPPRHARGRSAPRVRGRAAGPASPRSSSSNESPTSPPRTTGPSSVSRRRPDVRPCVPAPAGLTPGRISASPSCSTYVAPGKVDPLPHRVVSSVRASASSRRWTWIGMPGRAGCRRSGRSGGAC